MKKLKVFVWIILFAFTFTAFAFVKAKDANVHSTLPKSIDLGETGIVETPLKTQMGFIFTEVYINQQGPFRFMVDTGASLSIISNELAQKLKLNPVDKKIKVLHTEHRKAQIDTNLYIVDQLKMGEALINAMPLFASNTATDAFLLLHDLEIVGVLGANLFYDVVLTLNVGQGKMILNHPKNTIAKGTLMQMHPDYPVPVIKSKVIKNKNETEYLFLIDSGYNGFIKMPVCFPYKKALQKEIVTYDIFNRAQKGFIAELDGTLLIGDKSLEYPLVKYTFGDCIEEESWGLIGASYLKYQSISFDQHNRIVTLH